MATKKAPKVPSTKAARVVSSKTPKTSRTLATRLHLEEVAIIKEAASRLGKNAGAYLRICGVDAACKMMNIEIPDLRGGFSHLIAALTAEGQSTVTNVGIISRGYEHFIDKLRILGADFVYEG